MKAIGGYFELELRRGEHYHKDALSLNTARNCFEYILLARKYKKVYIPYYTCEVILQPLIKHCITYEFYSINEKLEPVEIKSLRFDEAYLYTNYYGVKQRCVEKLASIYGSQLIIDNAQAFYAPRISAIDTFYSPRKFFGVPDGGYLYTDCILEKSFPEDISYIRMQHLLQRIDEGAENGYPFFRNNDDALDNQSIRVMSNLTQQVLYGVDYEKISQQRRENYIYLHNALHQNNNLNFDLQTDCVPMFYPFYTDDLALRARLIKRKIYVATYWSNVLSWCNPTDIEYVFTNHIIPLPIDQRYGVEDMKLIIAVVKNNVIK